MTEALSTRYTRTAEGTYLAYQVSGDGPIDLVLPITGSAAIELIWEEPEVSQFISRLASFCRLITFDPRGFGSSGRLDAGAVPAVQAWKDDIGAVMDAVGTDSAAFLSWGESSGATMFFAATYPERVRSLVLVNAYARYARDDATPWGLSFGSHSRLCLGHRGNVGQRCVHGDPGTEHGPNGECTTTLGAHRAPYGQSGRTGGKHACRDGKRCDLRAVSDSGADTRDHQTRRSTRPP